MSRGRILQPTRELSEADSLLQIIQEISRNAQFQFLGDTGSTETESRALNAYGQCLKLVDRLRFGVDHDAGCFLSRPLVKKQRFLMAADTDTDVRYLAQREAIQDGGQRRHKVD